MHSDLTRNDEKTQPPGPLDVEAGPLEPQDGARLSPRQEPAPRLSSLGSRPATNLPEESEWTDPPDYCCTEVQRFAATAAGSSAPDSAPRQADSSSGTDSAAPKKKRKTHRRREETAAVGQGVYFLLTIALLFAAARFLLPTIVEEMRYGWHRGELRAEYETSGEGLRNVSLDSLSQAYQMVSQRVGPSVVHIDVQRKLSAEEREIAELMHRGPAAPQISDQGSGVVVDKEGYVLTNEHVIAGSESIEVGLSDGRRVSASIVGIDSLTDLAVLKIQADGLIPITFGNSENARVGSPVWAVGSPFGLDHTVTFGILSGKHRVVKASTRYQDFMQSDVAVNPGNSGGPLVDTRGKLIGINTAIVGDTYRGVSFSIPSNVVQRVYQRIRDTGTYERGWLGVSLSEVPDDRLSGTNHRLRGALVEALASADSPAAAAGLQAGDVITSLDGLALSDMGHLMRVVGDLAAGEKIEVEIIRDGTKRHVSVTIGKRPPEFASR